MSPTALYRCTTAQHAQVAAITDVCLLCYTRAQFLAARPVSQVYRRNVANRVPFLKKEYQENGPDIAISENDSKTVRQLGQRLRIVSPIASDRELAKSIVNSTKAHKKLVPRRFSDISGRIGARTRNGEESGPLDSHEAYTNALKTRAGPLPPFNVPRPYKIPFQKDAHDAKFVSPQHKALAAVQIDVEQDPLEDVEISDVSHASDITPHLNRRAKDRFGVKKLKRKEYEKRGQGLEEEAAPRSKERERRPTRNRSSYNRPEKDYDVRQADSDDYKASKKARKIRREEDKRTGPPSPISLPEFISVSNLASALRVRVEDFLEKMTELGFDDLKHDHILDAETAGLIAAEFNFEPMADTVEEIDITRREEVPDKTLLPTRPPVVTIMGHVDHGKTTLLDYLRQSSVAASEHGGITQHIGAFSVPMSGGRVVTFLDTPGHAAFLEMRQRGANVTDIVILVVAADDSVKPQTIEAIKHAQQAKVPMIVAINKIDKEDTNLERVKQDLGRYGVELEEFGGDTQVVCVSGKTGQGMSELEDAAVALADVLDMRAEVDGPVEGWVLEATTKRAGRVATILVRRGTLRPGDIILAGHAWARVRSLHNEAGIEVMSASPGQPIEVDGWREQPKAGDELLQAEDEQQAKSAIEYRMAAQDRIQMAADISAVNEQRRIEQEKREKAEKAKEAIDQDLIEDTMDQTLTDEPSTSQKEVSLIVKADVSGSLEAVANAITALGNDMVHARILRSGVGPVTEFDIEHAAVAGGHVVLFNTTVDGSLEREAEARGVKIVDQSIIYRLVDDVKAILETRLPAIISTKVIGEAEIAQIFDINIKGRVSLPIAGCRVRNGMIERGAKVKVLRDKNVVYDGLLTSLKNAKKDVNETRKGSECGIGFNDWTDFKVGDQIQTYEEISEKRRL